MKTVNKAISGLAIFLLLASFSTFAADHRDPPLTGNYNFLLEIEGAVLGRFKSIEGLGAEIEVIEFRDGGDDGVIRKLPGRTTYGDIVLKRGYTATDDLWKWMEEIIEGEFVRKNGSIRVTSSRGGEVARFNLFNAWPVKYRLSLEQRKGSEIAIEELVLTVEGIDLN